MIESKNCSFCYQNSKTNALKSVDLIIYPGECVVLTGKSGCGKTTMTRFFNGLAPSYFCGEMTGSCHTFGLESGAASIEEYVPFTGSVFQNPKTQYFNVDTTAELAFPCENMGIPSRDIQKRVRECAEEFNLGKLLNRSIFQLSGGEKQRIAFGAACMLQPKLLILDEPTSNLDDLAIQDLHDRIAEKKAEGTTIIIAEHRLAWLSDLADRFCYFENGEVKGQWTAKEFCSLSLAQLHEMGLRSTNIEPYHKITFEMRREKTKCSNPMISAHNLSVGYGKKSPVYQIDDFEIGKGEIVALMGRNGIGKSTFVKTLCGLLKPQGGEITPVKEKERLKHSFMVMQDVNYQLFSDSVREEVLLCSKRQELCDCVLDALGLLPFADRHPMSLSGGQKQRVAIASAILSDKDFIVLDEPTSGLDYYHMTQTAKLLNLLKKQGKAILVITHDEELVADCCDRVVFLHEKEEDSGRIS